MIITAIAHRLTRAGSWNNLGDAKRSLKGSLEQRITAKLPVNAWQNRPAIDDKGLRILADHRRCHPDHNHSQ